MFPVDAFQNTILEFAQILNDLSIRFHLTGGITSLAYGEPRMTQDVDVVIDPLSTQNLLNELIIRLKHSRFLFDENTLRNAVAEQRQFQLLDAVETLKLDVYPRELISGELERSQNFEVFQGVLLPLVSLGDAIVSKLIWISKGSHKSRRDVRQLHKQCGEHDLGFVRGHATGLGLEDLLNEVLHENDEIEG